MKIAFEVVGLICCLVLPAAVPLASAQEAQPDDYRRSINLAQGYVKERRFEDAITMFRKAYASKPDPSVLAQMGNAFMALGMSTEAKDVFNQVLAKDGEIKLMALHRHSSGNRCLGMLSISRKQVLWAGPKDNFSADPKGIGKIESLEFTSNGGAVPGLRMRAQNKNWFLEYLIYDVGQYQMNLNGEAVYSGDDLQKAENATALIIKLLGNASSTLPASTISSQQSLPSSGAAAGSAATGAKTDDRPSQVPEAAKSASADASVELKEGQTPEEVEKNLGKPQDTITVKENVIYVYPTVKVIFEKGKLVDVQYPESGSVQQQATVTGPFDQQESASTRTSEAANDHKPTAAQSTDESPIGIWSGNIVQSGAPPYSATVTFDGSSLGKIDYKTLRCGGLLTLRARSQSKFVFTEKILYNGSTYCISGGGVEIEVRLDGAVDYRWYFPNGSLGASGVLYSATR